jgi:glucose-1-phosphate cytidylyltransferase
MKAVILAGGLGTRISEETQLKPKPMVEIGGKPILWHIMKIYSHYGINDFIICLGYRGYVIKEYFANYRRHMSDITYDLAKNKVILHNNKAESWKVTLVDTGEDTMTGGRVKFIKDYIKNDKTFCLTYGDGVSNVNIKKLIKHHKDHGKIATLTATKPPGRFGALKIDRENTIESFLEKPAGDGSYINGGFFVLNREVFDYIKGSETVFEKEPLEKLAKEGNLSAFKHDGFWQPMDTLRDKNYLESLYDSGRAPWIHWDKKRNG